MNKLVNNLNKKVILYANLMFSKINRIIVSKILQEKEFLIKKIQLVN